MPRPDLQDETVEDQQNVIEEMVDEKVECNDEDELEDSAAESSSSYTVHPSGRLTLVFKNSPVCSPAHSPAMPSNNTICDVRVKLERCDDIDHVSGTPSKRIRMEDGRSHNSASFLPQADPPRQPKSEISLSEDDAAVAGLLECSSTSGSHILDMSHEEVTHIGQLHDGLDVLSAADGSVQYGVFSSPKPDLKPSADCISESDMIVDSDGGVVTKTEASDGEVMSAVDSLMADLGQLNAAMPTSVRTAVPNGSVYLSPSVSKHLLAKRTSDDNMVITRSLAGASLTVTEADDSVDDVRQRHCLDTSSLLHSSQSSPFCKWGNGTTSDQEPDLDAAIKSILS